MANSPKTKPHDPEDMRKSFETQLLELRKEIAKISKSISGHGAEVAADARDTAAKAYGDASARAARAARQLRTQAYSVSEVAKSNPGATTAVVGIAGLIGFLIGFAFAKGTSDEGRHWRR